METNLPLNIMTEVDTDKTYIELFDLKTGQISQSPDSHGIFGSRWSPYGRSIVAPSSDNNRLVLFDVKSEQWRQLDTDLFFGYLTWSHDSAYA